MTITSDNNWYVLVTRSRYEKKCEQLLIKKGFEVFLPLQKIMRQWSDRKKEVEIPLFSGYLFIRYDKSKRFDVLNTPGIAHFVRYNKQDAVISDQHIQAIKIAIDDFVKMDIIEKQFLEGEEIVIKSGPFKGFYGKIVNHKNNRKILITVDTLGKDILIEIGKTNIEKIL